MLKSVANELEELCEAVEQLEAQLPRLSRQEQIDVCARVVSFRNTAKRIEEYIKLNIRTWRGGPDNLSAGYVLGEAFRAYLNLYQVTRLDQEALQLNHPRIYNKCLKTKTEGQIRFEAR